MVCLSLIQRTYIGDARHTPDAPDPRRIFQGLLMQGCAAAPQPSRGRGGAVQRDGEGAWKLRQAPDKPACFAALLVRTSTSTWELAHICSFTFLITHTHLHLLDLLTHSICFQASELTNHFQHGD